MRGWLSSGGITCKTYNSQSVVDYVTFSQIFVSRVLEFEIRECPIELKFDHAHVLVKLDFASISPHNRQENAHKTKYS